VLRYDGPGNAASVSPGNIWHTVTGFEERVIAFCGAKMIQLFSYPAFSAIDDVPTDSARDWQAALGSITACLLDDLVYPLPGDAILSGKRDHGDKIFRVGFHYVNLLFGS